MNQKFQTEMLQLTFIYNMGNLYLQVGKKSLKDLDKRWQDNYFRA